MHLACVERHRRWSDADAERWLEARAPLGMHFGLERMEQLMKLLCEPHRSFRSVHVVGTNGKTSTVRMIAALLERHGITTGSYLSPHLIGFADRLEIREARVAPARFAAAVQTVAAVVDEVDAGRAVNDRVTQFEALTAAAYLELAQQGVEVAVIEAGLGGRYDATSVIHSSVQVLTNVDLDHTELLGPTRGAIAAEKLAVVPTRGALVVGNALHPEAQQVAVAVAAQRDARLTEAAPEPSEEIGLNGAFQRRNFALAEAAARTVLGVPLDPDAVRRAAADVRSPGRFEIVDRAPLTVFDAAHNPDGVAALTGSLPEVFEPGEGRMIAVVSMLRDKDAAGMLELLLAHCDAVVVTSNSSPRAHTADELAVLVDDLGGALEAIDDDPVSALRQARRAAGRSGMVLATGSICLVGDLLRARALRVAEDVAPAATSPLAAVEA